MAGEVSIDKVGLYGWDSDGPVVGEVAVYGWVLEGGEEIVIPNHSDRAVNLLIEELRYQYGEG